MAIGRAAWRAEAVPQVAACPEMEGRQCDGGRRSCQPCSVNPAMTAQQTNLNRSYSMGPKSPKHQLTFDFCFRIWKLAPKIFPYREYQIQYYLSSSRAGSWDCQKVNVSRLE
jgi:hypothetical protein